MSKEKVPLTCESLKKLLHVRSSVEYVMAILPGGDHTYIDGEVPENYVQLHVKLKNRSRPLIFDRAYFTKRGVEF